MEWLPKDFEGSWTLAGSISRQGVCLHSGEESTVTLSPSESPGFYISWSKSNEPPIELNLSQVIHSHLCTTMVIGNKRIATVEHLFAALIGCGLTHVHIEINGNEIPLLDGSSICWVLAIQEIGIKEAKSPRKKNPILKKTLTLSKGQSVITAIPSDSLKLIGIIDFPYEAIGQQIFSIDLTPSTFVEEIAPARTFGFKDQIDSLMNQGLIKGGDLTNSLVCDGDSWLNPPLRFKDEPVRHKLLDLIGDLALIGLPKAQVLVYRGSHVLHAELAKALLKECSLA